MPSIIQSVSGEEKKLLVSDEKAVTFHLSDPAGIIPWNATPGKACGATLGDICSTSEVRGHWPDLLAFFPFLISPLPPSPISLSSSTVLPVLPPLHRCFSRGRSHRHRIGKLLMNPADNVRPKICMLPWRAYQLPWQPHLSRLSVCHPIGSDLTLQPSSACECVLTEGQCFTLLRGRTFFFCVCVVCKWRCWKSAAPDVVSGHLKVTWKCARMFHS